jgi:hypothetical protein
MMVTRSAPVCGLTILPVPSGFDPKHITGDYRTEDAAISSRARPAGNCVGRTEP